MSTKKVAIACQGGGTHAAFTWGVLTQILETKKAWDADAGEGEKFDIIAISGTSAGALCALATWYGLVPNTADADCGTIDKAIDRLDFLWTNFAATTPVEIAHNQMVGTLLQWKAKGVPFPGSNPYAGHGNVGLSALAMMGARSDYLGFPDLLNALCPDFKTIDWAAVAKADRRIMVGAIEVLSGNFEIFDSNKTLEQLGLLASPPKVDQYDVTRWRMRRAISLEAWQRRERCPRFCQRKSSATRRFPPVNPTKSSPETRIIGMACIRRTPPFAISSTSEQRPRSLTKSGSCASIRKKSRRNPRRSASKTSRIVRTTWPVISR